MTDTQNKLDQLIEKGKAFTFENFSTKGVRGYPEAYTSDWIIWREQSQQIISQLGRQNHAAKAIISGLNSPTLGNGEDTFRHARDSMLNGLIAAKALWEDTPAPLPEQRHEPVRTEKSNRIFIVHGHDHVAKNELEAYLKDLGLVPIVLHRQADEGKTVIEKFEKHSDVGYAFILLTPDEIAYPIADDAKPDNQRHKEKRARPNVVLEFGFFVGRLGRENVCCIYTGDVDLPSDVHGILYKEFHRNIKEVFYDIGVELKARKYNLA
jgi:predicted nucleotide-binding protein